MHEAYQDEALNSLSQQDRADLAHRLKLVMDELDTGVAGGRAARELFTVITFGCSLALIPWIVLLTKLLPASHSVGNWRQTWAGFDIVLCCALAVTAVLAYVRRQEVVLAAFITATLLCCDAWFDVMTAAPGWDRLSSLGSAVIELVLAMVLFNTIRLFLHHLARTATMPASASPFGVLAGRGPLAGVASGRLRWRDLRGRSS